MPICDRVFYSAVASAKCSKAHSGLRTVAFRTQYSSHYLKAGLPVPAGAKADTMAEPLEYLRTDRGIKACLDTLGFWPIYGN